MRKKSRLSQAILVLGTIVLLSGCLSGIPSTVSESPPPTENATHEMSVSFWGLDGSTAQKKWSSESVRVGYTLPPNRSVFLVAYENETILGYTQATNTWSEHPVAADGDQIQLNTSLNGTHTLRVVVVEDTNQNGTFDPTTDQSYRQNGDIVRASPQTIDFSRFTTNSTSR